MAVGGLFVVLRDTILSRVVKWFFSPFLPLDSLDYLRH